MPHNVRHVRSNDTPWGMGGGLAYASSGNLSRRPLFSGHAGEVLDRFCKLGDGGVGIAFGDAVAHAVLQVPFKDDLSCFMKGALGGIDLHEDVLAGDILVNHAVDGLNLADDLFEAPVKIRRIHALLHELSDQNGTSSSRLSIGAEAAAGEGCGAGAGAA